MRWWLGVVLAAAATQVSGQANPPKVETIPLPPEAHGLLAYTSIHFSFEAPTDQLQSWEIEVGQNLTGTYAVKGGTPVPISVGQTTFSKINFGDSAVSEKRCETKHKNIAKTGKKTITYVLGVVPSSCTFNFSDDADLNIAADTFHAIAETMQFGERLTHERRFDRLGLDAEISSLMSEVKEGRAIELQNIAPVLTALVNDERVMDMVRRKASVVLQGVGVTAEESPR